jgi:hypothetical protein
MFAGYAATLLLAINLGLTTPPDEVFGLTKVHQIHASVTTKDYAAMQPPPPKAFGKAPRSLIPMLVRATSGSSSSTSPPMYW